MKTPIDPERIKVIERVKRGTRHPDILAVCDMAEHPMVVERIVEIPVEREKRKPKRDRAAYMREYRRRK